MVFSGSNFVKKGFITIFTPPRRYILMYCCGERLNVTRLIFNANGHYKRVQFGVCQDCGTPQTLVYSMNKNGIDREKRFIGKTALQEFKKYQRLKNNSKQGSFANQNIYYGDFKRTNKKDEKGNPVYQQLRKNFNNQTEYLGEIRTFYSSLCLSS